MELQSHLHEQEIKSELFTNEVAKLNGIIKELQDKLRELEYM
jgi:hypothetical protein